jgi:hypothetical protein
LDQVVAAIAAGFEGLQDWTALGCPEIFDFPEMQVRFEISVTVKPLFVRILPWPQAY